MERRRSSITASNNRPLKSLADMIKRKARPFRQNLLGKRVDYSVVPLLLWDLNKNSSMWSTKEMALELFQPF
jgi:DNA-directed RNA polymerase subunit beta'